MRRWKLGMMLALALAGLVGGLYVASAAAQMSEIQGTEVQNLPGAAVRVVPTVCGQFNTVPSPNSDTGNNNLNGIEAISSNDIWAAGEYYIGAGSVTLVEHWDGSAWSIVPSPNVATGDNYNNVLYGVAAAASNDVWAVGDYLHGSGRLTLVEHWDGSAWSIVPSPNPGSGSNDLHGVSAVASNDVWAVGYYYNGSNNGQELIEHWNGIDWSVVPGPNAGESSKKLIGVSAVASNDVWAVGESGDGSIADPSQTLIEHWDGTAWTVVPSPNIGTSHNGLGAVSAVAGNDVWAAGYTASGSGIETMMQHWDGISWSVVTSPNSDLQYNFLHGVSAAASNDVWAVGEYGDGSSAYQTLIEHWNGSNWSIVPSPSPGVSDNKLNSVSALPGSEVWAVGEYVSSGAETLVEQYIPCTGSPTPTSTPAPPTETPTSTPTATQCPYRFCDVPPENPFYAQIMCLTDRGIISGYEDGTFRPGNNITRSQIAKLVSNASNINDDPGPQLFEDVGIGNPFYLWINRLSNRGFMGGYPCGGEGEPCGTDQMPYFRPFENATRGQLAKIVSNAYGAGGTPTGQFYADVLEVNPFYTWIMRLTDLSVMSGYQCGGAGEPCDEQQRPYFRPYNNVTRGQASKIVANTFFPGCQTSSP